MQYVKHPLDLDNKNSCYSVPERDEGHNYSILDCWREIETVIENECVITQEKALERLFEYLHLQKDTNIWKVEQEARIIIGKNVPKSAKCLKRGYYMTLPHGCIAKIYIGKYMRGVYKKRLKKIANRLQAETYEVEPKIINGNWDVKITSA